MNCATEHRRPSRLLLPATVAAIVAVLGVVAGCNIVGPAYLMVHGPEKVKAVYHLDKDRPTLIFVDDRNNHMPRRSLRLVAAQQAQDVLLKHEVLTNVIDVRPALAVASREREGQAISVVDVGRAVGAEVVIYVSVDQFTVSTDGQSISPAVTMRMRVIDVTRNERVFPLDHPRGWSFGVRTHPKAGYAPIERGDLIQAENMLAQQAGLAIAQLFYDHEKPLTARAEEQ